MKFETTYEDFKIVFDRCNEKYIIYDKDGNVIKESKVGAEILKYLKETIYKIYPHTTENVEKLSRTIKIIKMFKILHINLEIKADEEA